MSAATPNNGHNVGQSPKTVSPTNGIEFKEDEAWSGDEDDAELDEEGGDGDRKRKRQRLSRPLSVSCELCKSRKVKCDRGHPRCGWCVRNGQVCEYKERKKPGLRAGYGRELESRLDKLEGVLQTQQHVLQQLANHLGSGPSPVAQQSSPSAHSQHVPSAETALYMQTPGMYSAAQPSNGRYGALPPGDTSQPQQQQIQHRGSQPSTHIPAPSSETYAASNPPLESPSYNIGSAPQGGPGPDSAVNAVSQDQDFPPYDLLYALTDLFFKHVNTWCPILHRRSTLDALFGSSALEEADRILLHAIVATTLRFSTDGRLNPQARNRYHSVSKQKVLLYGLENSSVKALQALVILALDIVGSSNGPPGWNLLALIARSVVQLGLAVETTSASVAPMYPSIYTLRAMVLPEPRSFIEDETRRRVFWMIYLLDRYATISTAFEFALDDKEIDRKLPCRDDLWARNQPVETRWFQPSDRSTEYHADVPENLGSFSYYIEILGILTQIHRFLKKPVDIGALGDVEQWQQEYRQLDNKLNAWKFGLPSEYGNSSRLFNPNSANKNVNCIWVMLHITYHTAVIRLHSSAAYPTTRSPIFTPSYSASQRCHTAVEDICTLCTYVRNNNMLTKLGPPFAFSLWVAARLLLVHGSTIDHLVNPAIHPLVETLREMGYYWEVANRYATLLSRVLSEYNDSERGPPGVARETPSSVKILADMRRCAYDLDFLISRQPKPLNSITPARGRTPAPNELEYLDVFDFFNMPRLPFQTSGDASMAGNGPGDTSEYQPAMDNSEFNFPFNYDTSSDWFMKHST